MNVYSALSKKIGFATSGESMLVPNSSICKGLLEEVNAGSITAFESVFRIRRFAATPTDADGVIAMKYIEEAFVAGSKIWQNKWVGKTYSDDETRA